MCKKLKCSELYTNTTTTKHKKIIVKDGMEFEPATSRSPIGCVTPEPPSQLKIAISQAI